MSAGDCTSTGTKHSRSKHFYCAAYVQSVIYQDSRALGRLVRPRVVLDSHSECPSTLRASLIYDYWQPSIDCKLAPEQHLRIPLDAAYRTTSAFFLSTFLTRTGGQGGVIALPGRQEWSGSRTAAAVSQEVQRQQYFAQARRAWEESEGKHSQSRHPLARSDAEFTLETGAG